MISEIRFRCRAYHSHYLAPGARIPSVIPFFVDDGSDSEEKITDQSERQIVDWLIGMPPARDLLLEELGLPTNTYIQAGITEPLVERSRSLPPGDIDLILVSEPCHAIAIQVKRIRIRAETTHRDSTPGRLLGNITRLVEQANGSRAIGFCENYALVLMECYGVQRSEYNFLSRGSSPDVFRRIYRLTKDQPIHPDVGVIFVEITQPMIASVNQAGMVAVCADKPAIPLDQTPEITARVRQLMAHKASM